MFKFKAVMFWVTTKDEIFCSDLKLMRRYFATPLKGTRWSSNGLRMESSKGLIWRGGKPQPKCKEGYRGDGIKLCVDLDECSAGMHKCDAFAMCKNYVGTHRCKCRRGFLDTGMAYKGECQGKPDYSRFCLLVALLIVFLNILLERKWIREDASVSSSRLSIASKVIIPMRDTKIKANKKSQNAFKLEKHLTLQNSFESTNDFHGQLKCLTCAFSVG